MYTPHPWLLSQQLTNTLWHPVGFCNSAKGLPPCPTLSHTAFRVYKPTSLFYLFSCMACICRSCLPLFPQGLRAEAKKGLVEPYSPFSALGLTPAPLGSGASFPASLQPAARFFLIPGHISMALDGFPLPGSIHSAESSPGSKPPGGQKSFSGHWPCCFITSPVCADIHLAVYPCPTLLQPCWPLLAWTQPVTYYESFSLDQISPAPDNVIFTHLICLCDCSPNSMQYVLC